MMKIKTYKSMDEFWNDPIKQNQDGSCSVLVSYGIREENNQLEIKAYFPETIEELEEMVVASEGK